MVRKQNKSPIFQKIETGMIEWEQRYTPSLDWEQTNYIQKCSAHINDGWDWLRNN